MRHHITVLDLATIRGLLDGNAGVRRVFDDDSGILTAFYRQKKTLKGAHADGAATAASKAARRVGMAAAQ